MRRSVAMSIAEARIPLLVALVSLAACGREEVAKAPESGYRVYEPRRGRRETVEPGVEYVDVTEAAGIDFRHVSGAFGEKYLPETMGSGVGILDYDGDGDRDLLFVQSNHWKGKRTATMRLYRNEGGWRFRDATVEAGLAVPCYGMGVTIADFDADGDPDVYVT